MKKKKKMSVTLALWHRGTWGQCPNRNRSTICSTHIDCVKSLVTVETNSDRSHRGYNVRSLINFNRSKCNFSLADFFESQHQQRMHIRPQRKHVYAYISFLLRHLWNRFVTPLARHLPLAEWYVHVLSGECKSADAIRIVRVNEMVCFALRIAAINECIKQTFFHRLFSNHVSQLSTLFYIEHSPNLRRIAKGVAGRPNKQQTHYFKTIAIATTFDPLDLTIGDIVAHSIQSQRLKQLLSEHVNWNIHRIVLWLWNLRGISLATINSTCLFHCYSFIFMRTIIRFRNAYTYWFPSGFFGKRKKWNYVRLQIDFIVAQAQDYNKYESISILSTADISASRHIFEFI